MRDADAQLDAGGVCAGDGVLAARMDRVEGRYAVHLLTTGSFLAKLPPITHLLLAMMGSMSVLPCACRR